MTDKNKTEIAVVLDRSGSMTAIATDMVGGFTTFVENQRKLPGECALSLYQFDHAYETLYEEKPLADVPPLRLEPRGNTALYDAVGRTILQLGRRLSSKPEHERPGSVVVMIITDGHENASQEFSLSRLREMIKTQEEKYQWRFAFMGSAGLQDAQQLQISQTSTMSYDANTQGVWRMYNQASKGIGAYRNAVSCGVTGQSLNMNNPDSEDEPDEV